MHARRAPRGQVRVYDFRRPDRFSKEQLRALMLVHEHVARAMATGLAAFYRGLVQVGVGELRQETYAEFIDSLPNPGVLGVLAFPPLEGRALLDLDPGLAFPLLDRIFGGPGEPLDAVRPLTEIELTVMRRVFDALARAVGEAWTALGPVQPAVESLETNPAYLQLAAPGEVVLTVPLAAQMGGHRGLLRLGLPYVLLEPVLPRLSSGPWLGTNRRPAPEPVLERLLGRVEVTVSARLGAARLSLSEVMGLEVGDVIRLGHRRDRPVAVLVEGLPKYWAQPGRVGNRLAVRVLGAVDGVEGG